MSALTMAERLERLSMPEPNSGCVLWTGTLNGDGYGLITVLRNRRAGVRRMGMAHRVSYAVHRGPIPEGLSLDHLCRVRCCINPGHLEPVTWQVNILRGVGVAARYAQATHCPAGHPYDMVTPRQRGCRQCRRRTSLAWYARRKRAG